MKIACDYLHKNIFCNQEKVLKATNISTNEIFTAFRERMNAERRIRKTKI